MYVSLRFICYSFQKVKEQVWLNLHSSCMQQAQAKQPNVNVSLSLFMLHFRKILELGIKLGIRKIGWIKYSRSVLEKKGVKIVWDIIISIRRRSQHKATINPSLTDKKKFKVCQPQVILPYSRQWSWDCLYSKAVCLVYISTALHCSKYTKCLDGMKTDESCIAWNHIPIT